MEHTPQMHFELEPRIISGNDVLSVSGLAKSYGDLFSNLNFEIKRGEKSQYRKQWNREDNTENHQRSG